MELIEDDHGYPLYRAVSKVKEALSQADTAAFSFQAGGIDIFIHMETVRRAGLAGLEPDQPLRARIADGRKGPLAVVIETIA